MTSGRGIFVVIEGTDGSGKGTQCERLADRLAQEGYDVATFDFPQYDQPSSYFVQQYLNGKYGTIEEVGPYTSSLFYALDRFEAASAIRQALAQGKIVLANRYVGSNMAHQGTKFEHAEERRGFFIWLDNLEFEMLRIPRPTMSFVLRVPAEIAQSLVDHKQKRSYTDKARDLHEADLDHLKRSVQVYDDMCQLFPNDFVRIDSTRDDQLLDITTVHDIIWQKLQPLLPPRPKEHQNAAPTELELPAIEEASIVKAESPNDASHQSEMAITATHGNVFAFTEELSQTAIVAVMARVLQSGDEARAALMEALTHTLDKDQKLQQQLIETYGERAVRQLTGMHMMIDQASCLLAGRMEQSRLTAYLDPSLLYTSYEHKDKTDKYRYFTPDYFEPKLREQYCAYMDQLFNLYTEILHGLVRYLQTTSSTPAATQDANWHQAIYRQAQEIARPVLPLATRTSLGLYASGEALEILIMRLMSDTLPEAHKAGEALLVQARRIAPVFMERVATPERGGAAIAYRATTHKKINRLAREYLPQQHADPTSAVQLTDVWPRNELDLVPDMLYRHSTLPLKALQTQVKEWPYDKKVTVLEAYIGERTNHHHRPDRALEKAHYSWDIVCDYDTFRQLRRHRMAEGMEEQELTPRYGYDIPQMVEKAELSDQFEACFDLSLRLYSLLQQAGYDYEAQYATLHGHKMRGKLIYNAREAFRMHASGPQPEGHTKAYAELMRAMHEKISEVHPILGDAIQSDLKHS